MARSLSLPSLADGIPDAVLLALDITAMILTGQLKPGDPVPSDEEHAHLTGTSEHQARTAKILLKRLGLIQRPPRGRYYLVTPRSATGTPNSSRYRQGKRQDMQATPDKEQFEYTPAETPAAELTNREIKQELENIEQQAELLNTRRAALEKQAILLATRRTALERERAKRATPARAASAREQPGKEQDDG